MTRVLALVDLSNQVRRAAHAFSELSHDGVRTGGLWGLMTYLARVVRQHGVTDFVACRDVRPYVRSSILPSYKADRPVEDDPGKVELIKDSWMLTDRFLDLVGARVAAVKGYEADDCIAALAARYAYRYDRIIVVSNDADLWQLLRHRRVRVLGGDPGTLMMPGDPIGPGGLTPDEYVVALALSGTHNAVPGIDGVGPKRSAAAIRDPGKMRTLRAVHGPLIDRNLTLIRLPFHTFPPGFVMPPRTGYFDTRAFVNFCAGLGINPRDSMVDAFGEVFG